MATSLGTCYTAPMEIIQYTLIRSKRKTIAIRILSEGDVEVRAPLRTPRRYLDMVVQEKEQWIAQKRSEIVARRQIYPPHRFLEGERFMLLGEPLRLTVSGGVKKPVREEDCLLVPVVEPERVPTMLEAWYKTFARAFFTERLDRFAPLCGVQYASLTLSGAESRWGSCSRGGNINMTWRLIMAPVDVIDYVVVHELCHIKEPNHQSAFWSCVEAVLPNYKEKRAWLKAHAHELEF